MAASSGFDSPATQRVPVVHRLCNWIVVVCDAIATDLFLNVLWLKNSFGNRIILCYFEEYIYIFQLDCKFYFVLLRVFICEIYHYNWHFLYIHVLMFFKDKIRIPLNCYAIFCCGFILHELESYMLESSSYIYSLYDAPAIGTLFVTHQPSPCCMHSPLFVMYQCGLHVVLWPWL